MSVDPKIRESLVRAAQFTLELVAKEGDEFAPMLTVVQADGMIQPILMAGDFELMLTTCRMLVDSKTSMDMLVHSADGYHIGVSTEGTTIEQATAEYAGTLQERFESGDTRVTEALNITFVTADETHAVKLPYRRKGKIIVWSESGRYDVSGTNVGGRYADVMRLTIDQARAAS